MQPLTSGEVKLFKFVAWGITLHLRNPIPKVSKDGFGNQVLGYSSMVFRKNPQPRFWGFSNTTPHSVRGILSTKDLNTITNPPPTRTGTHEILKSVTVKNPQPSRIPRLLPNMPKNYFRSRTKENSNYWKNSIFKSHTIQNHTSETKKKKNSSDTDITTCTEKSLEHQ